VFGAVSNAHRTQLRTMQPSMLPGMKNKKAA